MPFPLTTLQRRSTILSVAALSAVLLSACNATIPKDPASPYYQVSVGSTLKVLEKIEIPPGRARVFIQNGAITVNFNHYAPNCNVEVDKLDNENTQYIEPGEYRIRRVQLSMEEVVQAQPVQVAALGSDLVLANNTASDGKTMIYEGYHLWVEDPAENFTRLSCRGVYALPSDALPPSIDEMRQALGEVAHLVILGT